MRLWSCMVVLACPLMMFSNAAQAELSARDAVGKYRANDTAAKYYLAGLAEGYRMANSALKLLKQPPLFCMPANDTSSIDDHVDLISNAIQGRSEAQKVPVNAMMLLALQHKFPCPTTTSPSRGDSAILVLTCSGKTDNKKYGVLTSSRTWQDEVLTIDPTKKTVRHNDEPSGPTITRSTSTHHTWHEDGSVLVTEGSFNRLNGTAEERMTIPNTGMLSVNYYEHCVRAPPPRF